MTEKYSEGFGNFPKCNGLQENVVFLAKVSETSRDSVPGVVLISLTPRHSQNWGHLQKEVIRKERDVCSSEHCMGISQKLASRRGSTFRRRALTYEWTLTR